MDGDRYGRVEGQVNLWVYQSVPEHAPTANRHEVLTEYQPRRGGKISLAILRIVRYSFKTL